MQEIFYKNFSLKTHKKNWQISRPSVCQFEITFGCGLNCKHCCSACYNSPEFIGKELTTKQVKLILDKVYNAGAIWLCLTGGDPLSRKDFIEIYSYAKNKGFIITVFTNGFSITDKIINCFNKNPPFVIEITLNAVSEKLYEDISRVKGSFLKAIRGINAMLKAKLPLKIKTQVIKDNWEELPEIKKFIEEKGLEYNPTVLLNAGLDGDLTPCDLRISPEKIFNFKKRKPLVGNGYKLPKGVSSNAPLAAPKASVNRLFPCVITGGDAIYIDPYGNLLPCDCIREPKENLFRIDLIEARKKILDWLREKDFEGNSKCKTCALIELCNNCPGKALLEKGSLEETIDWYCELAKLKAGLATADAPR